MHPLLVRAEQELKLRGYSPRTRKSYLQHLRRFLRHAGPAPDAITADSIRDYLVGVADRGLSRAYHDQVASAIRFLLRYVCNLPLLLDSAPRPRKQSRLPQVLSTGELRGFFAAIDNPKHRAALLVAYSAGLRVSEVVRLRVGDLDPERHLIHIRSGKGRKDRYTLLSDVAWTSVQHYVAAFRPTNWLFPGASEARPLNTRTIQKVVAAARNRAGIQKRLTPHTLRHTFATQLLESGTDVRYIQELLGHASPKTTQIYTHVAQRDLARIRSPLDTL
ncbi:MAG TPA: tyrosine-type recombinase/integrase [Longimicrobiales bacterium]|nr:tyrosine-type recombinase/integrase [Longimicrobiales bacterium]